MKKTAVVLLLTLLGTSFLSAETPDPTPGDTGYSFGVLMGQSLHNAGVDYDLDQVIQGLRDQLTPGAKVHVETEQAKAILTAALTLAQTKANQVQIDKEKAWLGDHAKVAGVVTTASGLQYEVLSKGKGVLPKATDWVKVDYVGTLVDGTEFDSSVARGEPAVFPLNQVIPGWTEAIALMPVGSKYRLTIPSNLAYGAKGAGGVIPPFATLVFVVDLISIEQPPAEAAPEAGPESEAEPDPASPQP